MPSPIFRVLLVAPESGLKLGGAQVQAIQRSGLTVTPVLGEITMPQLQRELEAGQYDCLWIAAHGNPEGFLLADGILRKEEFVPMVGKRFRLVVLHSCESLEVGSMLQKQTPAAVVVTQAALPDRTAFITAANFARALAAHGDPYRAFQESHPGGAHIYLYLQGDDAFLAAAS